MRHLGSASARGEHSRPPDAHRGQPAERPLSSPRPGGGVRMSAVEQHVRLEAHEPPEARGVPRDGVRLLVSSRRKGSIVHGRFRDLPRFLAPGDLPRRQHVGHPSRGRAGDARRRGRARAPVLHPCTRPRPRPLLDRGATPRRRAVRRRRGRGGPRAPGRRDARILAPYAAPRLWLAHLDLPAPLETYLAEHGQPIRYGYVPQRWPLSAYQNVYAADVGSAEMPSAGRPSRRS